MGIGMKRFRGRSTPTVRRRPSKIRLATEVLLAYREVRRIRAGRTLPETITILREGPEPVADYVPASHWEALRLGRAVRRTLLAIPVDSRCLMQSLVLTSLLARRRISSELVIGVSADESFGAHAWVEHHGYAVLPPEQETFVRLVQL